ncbi:ComEA family DNA-binding protein [Geothrix limicola]|uniref:ComEA family DNA-binding protein n=1 Tax=Geothrix limicola TaxID=2927978 RepID=UPI002553C876|nr:helix-hairpin-helix domain-containing protein [Geothrix limicola]
MEVAGILGSDSKQHGGFQRPEELMNVKGIGEKSYAKLKPFLATTPAPHPAAPKK